MGASKVPAALLRRIEKLSPEFEAATRKLRAATEEQDIRAAENALSARFLLTPGAAEAAGMTKEESTAMTLLSYGQGYGWEPKR